MTLLPTAAVTRGAFRQAGIELRIQLLSWVSLSWLLVPGIGLAVLFFLRDTEVMGTAVSLAQLGIPGMLASSLLTGGVLGIASAIIAEREDGTLLRAKAVPGGMASHLLGDVVVYTVTALVPIILLLIAATVLIPGVAPNGPAAWFTLLWVCLLGMLATLPWGAVVGAVLRSPMALAWSSMILYGTLAVSGVFYPIAALPGWLQLIGKALPTYWIGLGMRSALLPADAVALEVGQSWQLPQTVLMLAVWSLIGLVVAPIALRRMARRQSGSQVSAARERIMARGY